MSSEKKAYSNIYFIFPLTFEQKGFMLVFHISEKELRMAKKGESYAQVGVDLKKWAQDYMRINNLNQSELADRLYNDAIDKDWEEVLAFMSFRKGLYKENKGTTSRIERAFMKAMKNKQTDKIQAAIKLLEE